MRLETDDVSLLTDVVKDKTRGDLYTDPEVSVPSRMPRVLALTRDGGQQPQEWRTRTLELDCCLTMCEVTSSNLPYRFILRKISYK